MRIVFLSVSIFLLVDLIAEAENDFEIKNKPASLRFFPKLFISVEILEPTISTLSRSSDEISSDKLKAIFLLGFRWDFDFLVPDTSYHTFMYEHRSKSAQEYAILEKKLQQLLANETNNFSQNDLINYLGKKAEIKAQMIYFARAL